VKSTYSEPLIGHLALVVVNRVVESEVKYPTSPKFPTPTLQNF